MLAKFLTRHALDLVNNQRIVGWIFHRLRRRSPVALEFFFDDRPVGKTVADLYREDLHDLGLHPDGRCGFEFSFPAGVDLAAHRRLAVHCMGSGSPLFCLDTAAIPRVFAGEPPKVFFMHIPKTAGTSFNAFAHQHYPADAASTHIESLDPACYPDMAAQYSYLAGHLRLEAILEHFDPSRFLLYSVIREPYRHLHSHLNWVRGVAARPEGGFAQKHPACIRRLGEQLNLPDKPVKEVLRAFVAGLDGFEFDFFDNCQTRYFLKYRPEKVTDADFASALANLPLFTSIGKTEHYGRFVEQFCAAHGLRCIAQESPFNISRQGRLYDVDDPEIRDILHPLVEFDLQLYEKAGTG